MKLVLALALAAAPSGLAMGPFVPYDSECPRVPGICGGTKGSGTCSNTEGYSCYRMEICGPPGYACLNCQNCIGYDAHADRVTGTIWAEKCCPEPPQCPQGLVKREPESDELYHKLESGTWC